VCTVELVTEFIVLPKARNIQYIYIFRTVLFIISHTILWKGAGYASIIYQVPDHNIIQYYTHETTNQTSVKSCIRSWFNYCCSLYYFKLWGKKNQILKVNTKPCKVKFKLFILFVGIFKNRFMIKWIILHCIRNNS